MLEQEVEERLVGLEKRVEELEAKRNEAENGHAEEPTLIPGAEYDFVPSVPDKVIYRGIAKIIGVRKASDDLGLSAREWELLSIREDENE